MRNSDFVSEKINVKISGHLTCSENANQEPQKEGEGYRTKTQVWEINVNWCLQHLMTSNENATGRLILPVRSDR